MPSESYKTCSKCREPQPVEQFSKNSKTEDGLHYWCKPCFKEYNAARARKRAKEWAAANPERARARSAKWRADNRDQVRAYMRARNIRQQYGIEIEEYEAIVAQPCGICGTTERQRVLDHDHDTGALRRALCPTCNSGIGMLNDDLALLRAAVAYLEEYE